MYRSMKTYISCSKSYGAPTRDVNSFVLDADRVNAVLRRHELDVVDVSRQVTDLASFRFAAR